MNARNLRFLFALALGLLAVTGTLALLRLPGSGPLLARAAPGTLYVAPGGACGEANPCYASVQAAVDAAAPGDEIRVAEGVYTDTSVRPQNDIITTGVITQVVYISKSVTLRGGYTTTFADPPDPKANPTTLDAQGRGRVVYITGDISPTIEGLRITGGNAVGLGGSMFGGGGGGVYIVTATATLRNNWVFSNTARDGGGAYLYKSAGTLTGNTVSTNTTDYDGGGVFLYESAATLNRNTITSNIARYGGGLRLYYSAAILTGNIVAFNTALAYLWPPAPHSGDTPPSKTTGPASPFKLGGGGLMLSLSPATLNSNIVFSNTSYYAGGGLLLFKSDAMLTNNVIADNRADNSGGLDIWGSSPRLLHTTIARNSSYDGSGLYVISHVDLLGTMYPSTVTMSDTILVGHAVGIYVRTCNTATLEATLWGTGDWANATDWGGGGNIFTGTINVWGDPAFVNPDAGDYHIGAASAAIDQGVNTGVTTDIDGERRPVGEGYDLGADEFPAALRVIKTAAPDPVQAGAQLTYTINIANTGDVTLTATVTDLLPVHITPSTTPSGSLILPGGTLTWSPVIIAPGDTWMQQVVVTVEHGYTGTLTNVAQVTTVEGATGIYTVTVNLPKVYLPLVISGGP